MYSMHSIQSQVYYDYPTIDTHGTIPYNKRGTSGWPIDRGAERCLMAAAGLSPNGMMNIGPFATTTGIQFMEDRDIQLILHKADSFRLSYYSERLSLDELLLKRTRTI